MTKTYLNRGWSSNLKSEGTMSENCSPTSQKSHYEFEVKVHLRGRSHARSQSSFTSDSLSSTSEHTPNGFSYTSSKAYSSKEKTEDWLCNVNSPGLPFRESKREQVNDQSEINKDAFIRSSSKTFDTLSRGNVASLIEKFQKRNTNPSNVLSRGSQNSILSKKASNKAEAVTINKSNPEFEIQYLKLDSTISDDGYNCIAPISSNSICVTDPKPLPHRKSISMYDWAIQNPDKPVFMANFEDEVSAKSVRHIIPKGKTARNPNINPLRIFVGTWNTEYGEFSLESMLACTPKAAKNVSGVPEFSIDDDFDAFNSSSIFIGSMNKENESRRQEIRNQFSDLLELNQSNRIRTSTGKYLSGEDGKKGSGGIESSLDDVVSTESDLKCSGGISARSDERKLSCTVPYFKQTPLIYDFDNNQRLQKEIEPLAYWISPGYDIYIIALQEVICMFKTLRLLDAILIYLNRVNSPTFYRVHFSEQKISGLGDGAYMTLKSTLIACFVSEDYTNRDDIVKVGSSKAISINPLNGSKGAVSIILTLHHQIVCFISCHLVTGKAHDRLRAREFIRRKLAEAYSGFPNINPTDVFHHIVWVGDFNFRVQELSAMIVLDHLSRNDFESIFSFDETCYSEFNVDLCSDGFEEPPVLFYPTYKKFIGRRPTDFFDPNWVKKVYNVDFKVRWYKGGRTKSRVPSWTDRILKWSHPELRSCLSFIPNTYKLSSPAADTFLLDSDHSPVSCGLVIFALNSLYSIPPVMFQDVREKGTHVPVTPSLKEHYCG